MLTRFCLYGFLKNQRYFEPFFMLALLAHELSFFWIGTLYACRSLTLNVLEIPSGAIADWWGRRGCMIFSFASYVLSFLTFAFAPNWLWFFPAMILFGIGDSFRTGTHKAMIFEWLRLQGRESERTRIYGITRSWSKFGSAISALLAAAFVLITGDYRSIFLFATIPYLINIVNFLGYPRELDGASAEDNSGHRLSIRQVFHQTIATLKMTWRSSALKRLTVESMAWEGVFHAIKDYLQPVLTATVFAVAVTKATGEPFADVGVTGRVPLNVIVIGITYCVLFLLSGWASRVAHRFVKTSGSESAASRRLWHWNLGLYCGLGFFDCLGWSAFVVVAFIGLIVLQNIWRPILISRFDEYSEPGRGATVLSIESQSQRLTTLVVAPLLGLALDWTTQSAEFVHFWPIGILGGMAALFMILMNRTDKTP